MGVLFVFTSSCKKDDNNGYKGVPVLTTASVTDINQTTATSGGNITADGGATVTARGVCWSTGQTPITSGNKSTGGKGAGEFSSSLNGLRPGTTYYVRAYAININGTGYGSAMSFTTQEGFTDLRDGNVYATITIGNQIWMAENLRYLPRVVGPLTGSNTTPCYYVYAYDGTDVNAAKAMTNYINYGVLYNWPAVMAGSESSTANPSGVQGICPTGWHVPTDAEWSTLTTYLGGVNVAGGKLKEIGNKHWVSPNTGATNETGFTALPGGFRDKDGTFGYVRYAGYWWRATEENAWAAWYLCMFYDGNPIVRYYSYKEFGYSVRCVRD